MHRSIQRGALAGLLAVVSAIACTAGNTAAPPTDGDPSGSAGAAASPSATAGSAGALGTAGAGTAGVGTAGAGTAGAGTAGAGTAGAGTAGAGTSGAAGAPSCVAPSAECGGQCRNLSNDSANCNACGTACAVGQMCSNSACVCATNRTSCSGSCVDTSSDPANCGACGSACTASQVCSQGKCGSGCASGLTKCGSACVDTTGSQANCGACGTACPVDQSCWQSKCICPTGESTCGANGACVDVQANTANCGSCGNKCVTGATCTAGVCACPAGQTACSGACVDTSKDGQNCGACGKACGSGTSCLYGACLDPNSVTCSGSATGNTCTSGANITLGEYWLNNNWWGASGFSGQSCIWQNCTMGDLVGWGTSFNWSGGPGQVKTYASIVFGWQWGWKLNAQNQRLVTVLPIQLNTSKAVNCGWNFTVTQSASTPTMVLDVSYDMFVHTIADAGTNNDPTDEIMIWLYRAGGAGPIGTKTGSPLTTSAGTFDLYDGMNTKWKVHSYVRQTNSSTAVLNMMDFYHDLASRGLVVNTKYLSTIQAGTEVFTGQGQLQTNGFYCRVQ